MFKRLVGTALLFGMAAAAPPAFASGCGSRDVMIERLESKYSEGLTAAGLQARGGQSTVLEVWSSEKTGTFTVIMTTADGVSCIVAAGTDWHQQKVAITTPGVEG
ncbi:MULTISPECIES: hypothetical protein [unclassified Shimia]|uniref:hypothetical protein n=1 Tax=unclassified Shimia TaxID=2630038 RepID=UPI00310C6D0F